MITEAQPVALKYLFTVEYKDGSTYKQNEQDVSFQDSSRSCFYDVAQRLDEVIKFSISGENNTFLVDMSDGSFEVNGTSFYMHDRDLTLRDARLIFYRQHTHKVNASCEELSHDIVYCIGWQANDEKGNNIKRIMEID